MTPDARLQMRSKMIEHLEAALAISDETKDGTTCYLIERALDQARADQWPALDARYDTKRPG